MQIDELGMGSVFGEISWALNVKRGATIKATSPGLLFTIEGSKLREIARSNSKLFLEICASQAPDFALEGLAFHITPSCATHSSR